MIRECVCVIRERESVCVCDKRVCDVTVQLFMQRCKVLEGLVCACVH